MGWTTQSSTDKSPCVATEGALTHSKPHRAALMFPQSKAPSGFTALEPAHSSGTSSQLWNQLTALEPAHSSETSSQLWNQLTALEPAHSPTESFLMQQLPPTARSPEPSVCGSTSRRKYLSVFPLRSGG